MAIAYINGMSNQTGENKMANKIMEIIGAIAVTGMVLLVAFAWIYGIIVLMNS
jgi:hypothetical protein